MKGEQIYLLTLAYLLFSCGCSPSIPQRDSKIVTAFIAEPTEGNKSATLRGREDVRPISVTMTKNLKAS